MKHVYFCIDRFFSAGAKFMIDLTYPLQMPLKFHCSTKIYLGPVYSGFVQRSSPESSPASQLQLQDNGRSTLKS